MCPCHIKDTVSCCIMCNGGRWLHMICIYYQQSQNSNRRCSLNIQLMMCIIGRIMSILCKCLVRLSCPGSIPLRRSDRMFCCMWDSLIMSIVCIYCLRPSMPQACMLYKHQTQYKQSNMLDYSYKTCMCLHLNNIQQHRTNKTGRCCTQNTCFYMVRIEEKCF